MDELEAAVAGLIIGLRRTGILDDAALAEVLSNVEQSGDAHSAAWRISSIVTTQYPPRPE